jgi:hypothetical protein
MTNVFWYAKGPEDHGKNCQKQPYPVGDATYHGAPQPLEVYEKIGCSAFLWPPPQPAHLAGPTGQVTDDVNAVKIGDSNIEFTIHGGELALRQVPP